MKNQRNIDSLTILFVRACVLGPYRLKTRLSINLAKEKLTRISSNPSLKSQLRPITSNHPPSESTMAHSKATMEFLLTALRWSRPYFIIVHYRLFYFVPVALFINTSQVATSTQRNDCCCSVSRGCLSRIIATMKIVYYIQSDNEN